MTPSDLAQALRVAFNLGQTYWQQADSESFNQHKKADLTRQKFDKLVRDTQALLLQKNNNDHSDLARITKG